MSEFRGSYTVTITPFTADGSAFDADAFRRFLDWQLEVGVPGVIVLGTTGEFLSVTDDERTQIVETAVRHVDCHIPVLVGTMNALAAAAGHPVGDVRPPLTRFADLQGEERDRITQLSSMMAALDEDVAELDAPV